MKSRHEWIVARVEELLRWCDTMEAQLPQNHTPGARLLDATLHQILNDDGQGEP